MEERRAGGPGDYRPGRDSDTWTCLEVTLGCHRAGASWGRCLRILPNPTCTRSLRCLSAASGAHLAVAGTPPHRLLFLKPRFSHLGHPTLTLHQLPSCLGSGGAHQSLSSFPALPLGPSLSHCLPGRCSSLPIARTSWRAVAGLRPGSLVPVGAWSVNEGGRNCGASV